MRGARSDLSPERPDVEGSVVAAPQLKGHSRALGQARDASSAECHWVRFDVPGTRRRQAHLLVLADLLVVADELQRIPLWVMEVQRADL